MIWKTLLTTPAGWLAIGVTAVSIALAWALRAFIRKKVREEEAAMRLNGRK